MESLGALSFPVTSYKVLRSHLGFPLSVDLPLRLCPVSPLDPGGDHQISNRSEQQIGINVTSVTSGSTLDTLGNRRPTDNHGLDGEPGTVQLNRQSRENN